MQRNLMSYGCLCLFLSLFATSCAYGGNSNPQTSPIAGVANADNCHRDIRIPVPENRGEIRVCESYTGAESNLSVVWMDEKEHRKVLWNEPNFMLDPEQANIWEIATHKNIPFLALSIFSGGANCCWEVLVFRLDKPAFFRRGFPSGAAPRFTTKAIECPLGATILPVHEDGSINSKSMIECLVNGLEAK